MSFSINPLNFASMKISTNGQQSIFLGQLSQLLSQMANQITSLQNSSGNLTQTANLGAQGSNFNYNANGLFSNAVSFKFSTSIKITINNLKVGSIFWMQILNTNLSSTSTLTINANDPGSNAYAPIIMDTAGSSGGSASYDMRTVGFPLLADTAYNMTGFTVTGPVMYFIML